MASKTNQATKLRSEIGQLYDILHERRWSVQAEQNNPVMMNIDNMQAMISRAQVDEERCELLSKVNNWLSLQTPGTEDYETGLMMKAAALRFTCSLEPIITNNYGPLMQAKEILKPYVDSPKAFYIYMQTLLLLHQVYKFKDQKNEALKVLKDAEEHYKKFTKNYNGLIWNFPNILKGEQPDPEQSHIDLNFTFYSLQNFLYLYYHGERDTEKQLEYAMGAAKYTEYCNSPARLFTNLSMITDIAILFIEHRYFKQVDHLLSGLMFNLVQYRRSLPKHERQTVSKVQSLVAFGFVSWGLSIAEDSLRNLEGRRELPVENDKYEEIDWFLEPGVEIYAHQFPIKLVTIPSELANVLKRARNWLKRYCKLSLEASIPVYPKGSEEIKRLEMRLQPFLK